MNKIILLVLVMTAFACQKSPDFLTFEKVPVPPPAAQKIDKTYTLDSSYSIGGSSKVDILWVIDNSSSMDSSQQSVLSNTSAFIQEFSKSSGLQWQMGLISTDESQAPFEGFNVNSLLDYKLPQATAVSRFQTAVSQLGIMGSTDEKEFTPVINALTTYPNFLRKDAYLAVIIVTDEAEHSYITTEEFVAKLTALKDGSAKKILSYGIFNFVDLGCSSYDRYSGSKFESFIQQTSGRIFKLCSPDFGTLLSQLGKDLVSKTQNYSSRILLTDRPIVNTIEVYMAGKKLLFGAGGQWVYDPIDNIVEITDAKLLNSGNSQVRVVFQPVIESK